MANMFKQISIVLLGFVFKAAFGKSSEGLVENIFKSIYMDKDSLPNNAYFFDSRRSILDCAASCNINISCLTFTFDKKSNLCYKSSGYVKDVGSKIYKSGNRDAVAELSTTEVNTTIEAHTTTTSESPTTTSTQEVTTTINREDLCTPDGYTYYPTENICMKLYTQKVDQLTNKAKCIADGAHLFLVKNAAIHSFLKTELDKLGSDDVFIDGEDPELDGSFVDWNGDPITYIVWKSGDPDLEDCMRLSKSSGFNFGDEYCSHSSYQFGCICQKDIP